MVVFTCIITVNTSDATGLTPVASKITDGPVIAVEAMICSHGELITGVVSDKNSEYLDVYSSSVIVNEEDLYCVVGFFKPNSIEEKINEYKFNIRGEKESKITSVEINVHYGNVNLTQLENLKKEKTTVLDDLSSVMGYYHYHENHTDFYKSIKIEVPRLNDEIKIDTLRLNSLKELKNSN